MGRVGRLTGGRPSRMTAIRRQLRTGGRTTAVAPALKPGCMGPARCSMSRARFHDLVLWPPKVKRPASKAHRAMTRRPLPGHLGSLLAHKPTALGRILQRRMPGADASPSGPSGGGCARVREQLLLVTRCDCHDATGRAAQPSLLGAMLVDLVGEMISALGPIQTSVRVAAPSAGHSRTHPQSLKPLCARIRQFAAVGRGSQTLFALKRIEHPDRQLPRQVAMAASRKARARARGMGPGAVLRVALSHQRQGLQGTRHRVSSEGPRTR